jgi:hypothetical protein
MEVSILVLSLSALSAFILGGCSTKSSDSSSSPSVSESEIAAGTVGGSAGASNGSQALDAFASSVCPTVINNSSSCSSTPTTEVMTYSGCSFTGFNNVWNGSQTLTFGGGYGVPSCTSTPVFAGGNTLARTWAAGTYVAVPGGYTVTVDAPGGGITSSGFSSYIPDNGVSVTFSGPIARAITISGIHLTASWSGISLFDHTISSSAINVSAGNVITTGTVTLQHNYARYVATSTFTNVGFTVGCCFPTSGSITTTFSNGAASETLAFNSTCGSATYNGAARTLSYCF